MSPSRPVGRVILGSVLGAVLFLPACGPPQDPTVKETPIRVLSETKGAGRQAERGDLVTINYRILLEDGSELLAADDYRFVIGTNSVIGGIDEAVQGMRVAGEREFLCPPHRHWGSGGYGDGAVPKDEILTISLALEAID